MNIFSFFFKERELQKNKRVAKKALKLFKKFFFLFVVERWKKNAHERKKEKEKGGKN
jgi:hypothetical protein